MKNNQINALAALAALAALSIWRHSTNGRYPGFGSEIWVRGTKAFQYFVGCSTWLHFIFFLSYMILFVQFIVTVWYVFHNDIYILHFL